MGRLGVWHLVPVNQSRPKLVTLRRGLWLGPSRRWASITPIVLDRYPKRDGDAEDMVVKACQYIDLPRPRDVVLMPGSLFTGAPPAKRFPPLPKKSGKTLDQHTHALLIFDEQVRGPVLLGTGRYRGYGLCRPYGPKEEV
jgi:CRISPR-associated protein Csb2